MYPASKELAEQLHQLSGWKYDLDGSYSLSLMLRKLDGWDLKLERFNQFDRWSVFADDEGKYRGDADTPEDALCQLAIELIKQKVIKI